MNNSQSNESILIKLIKKPLRSLNSIARKISYKNHYSAMVYSHLYFHIMNQPQQEPLIIFQMGKVGSKTIHESLKALNLNISLYHLHILSEENIRRNEDELKIAFRDDPYISGHFINNN